MQQKSSKVYIEVSVQFRKDGSMRPRSLQWEDGKIYKIDKIKDIRPAHAEKAGGQGDRYTIMVEGKERYLFFEHSSEYADQRPGKWFLERKE